MRPRIAYVFAALALAATGLLYAVYVLPGGMELSISPVGGGPAIAVLPIEPGERFTLHYIHSVDNAPIWEEHSVGADGTIYIEEERFEMFGAGMGHWEGHGTLAGRDGLQVIEGIHSPTGDFILRIGGEEVAHTLLWRQERIELSRRAPGRAVVFSARRISVLRRLGRLFTGHRAPADAGA